MCSQPGCFLVKFHKWVVPNIVKQGTKCSSLIGKDGLPLPQKVHLLEEQTQVKLYL